jgi:hypothetical protein
MSLLYVLNTESSRVSEDQIGHILSQFVRKLYQETGLQLASVAYTHEQAIEALFKSGMFVGEVLLEEVLWKNMNLQEKKDTLSRYLNEIEVANSELIVVDNYFFPQRFDDDYLDFITSILIGSKVKYITVITYPSYNENLVETFKEMLIPSAIQLEVRTSEDFHDRFWISLASKKGFKLGPSLNGVGKKIGTIEHLNKDDLKEISIEVEKIIN